VKGPPVLAWTLFFLYALWACALQGVLASPHYLGEWAPDLGLVLMCACAGRFAPGRAASAAIAVGLARASLGSDPPAALVAGYLGASLLGSLLRIGLEVDRPLAQAALAGVSAWFIAGLWVAARSAALAMSTPSVAVGAVRLWPLALATALASLLLAPLSARLPGLAPLGRRRP